MLSRWDGSRCFGGGLDQRRSRALPAPRSTQVSRDTHPNPHPAATAGFEGRKDLVGKKNSGSHQVLLFFFPKLTASSEGAKSDVDFLTSPGHTG